MRDDHQRLLDIIEAIENIESYTCRGLNAFREDELIQVWIVHHIGIIGEASGKISEQLRIAHTDIPWSNIIAMRNILVHQYFGIDLDEVWNTTQRDLPELKKKISDILLQ